MNISPCAKINLGLRITGVRKDGYHTLETVFYPVPIYDELQVTATEDPPVPQKDCELKVTGSFAFGGNEEDNLVVKAYHLLKRDFDLPNINIRLVKNIPTQAGMGGGSSDAASMIVLLDKLFNLELSTGKMEEYAVNLGADCPFFIKGTPAYATGIGEILCPIDSKKDILESCHLVIAKPPIAVSTKEAFKRIECRTPGKTCLEIIKQPIETWKDELINDFETPLFAIHPQLRNIKQKLYDSGAIYASVTGSGSALYGIFEQSPQIEEKDFPNMFIRSLLMTRKH